MTEGNSQAFVTCEKIIKILQEVGLVIEVHKDIIFFRVRRKYLIVDMFLGGRNSLIADGRD